MAIKGLMKGLPKNLSDLEEPCPICLLSKTTKITICLTIDISKFAPGFMLQINFAFFNVEIIRAFNSTFVAICSSNSHPFGFLSRRKLPYLEILKFLVTTLRNQDKKVAFIQVDEDVGLERSSELMRTCQNMNTIVQNIGGYASSLNGKSEIPNNTLDNITGALILNSSKKYKLWTCSSPRRPLFYTRSHLSALQNCALLFSTNFKFIFTFKNCTTQFSHWIVLCTKNISILCLFIKITHGFLAIELLTFFKNARFHFYCSRELSLFWLYKLYSLSRKGSVEKIFNMNQN